MAVENSNVPQTGAPLWRRFAALLYDLFILAAISMAYGALVIALYVSITGDHGEAYTPMFDGPLFPLGWLALIVGFYCFFWRRGGQTLGMRAWRLRLVDSTEGGNASLKQCALRALTGGFALALAGIGYWWAWVDKNRDCLHDRVSQTRVVVLPKR